MLIHHVLLKLIHILFYSLAGGVFPTSWAVLRLFLDQVHVLYNYYYCVSVHHNS